MIKNIFFDFDGVLVESVAVKTEAFYKMYLPFGEDIAQEAKNHHVLNGGMSRFEKFKLYHKEFLGIDISTSQIEELANQFSDIVMQDVIKAKEVNGAIDFLKDLKSKDIKCWVITGTPTPEIREIVAERGMTDYFIEVYGSPEKKPYWSEFIIKTHNLKREETLFFGDALADYEAAKHSKLEFVLRETEDNKKLFKGFKGVRFTNFSELSKATFE